MFQSSPYPGSRQPHVHTPTRPQAGRATGQPPDGKCRKRWVRCTVGRMQFEGPGGDSRPFLTWGAYRTRGPRPENFMVGARSLVIGSTPL